MRSRSVLCETETLKELQREARRTAASYFKKQRKAKSRPAPHGYGNGFFECICKRCVRASTLDAAAEDAKQACETALCRYLQARRRQRE